MSRTDMPHISTENVQGVAVHAPDGNRIGSIDHLMIDRSAGRVTYAVMSFGGFLGLGAGRFPVPWGALRYNRVLGGFQTNVTGRQLAEAPPFDPEVWSSRDWETRVHTHYGVRPYWE